MDFKLDNDLIEQIIFAMEDQQHRYLINRHTGELRRSEEKDEQEDGSEGCAEGVDPCLPIPEWQPIHGFRLMEKFVARLRNPLLRDRLKEALSSGKGVFRKFKDIIKTNREIEHAWFVFKDRELRQIVWEWYNERRELVGLERLNEEPEECDGLEDLLDSDFSILSGERRHLDPVRNLDREAFAARFPGADPALLAEFYRKSRAALPGPLEARSLLLVAETADRQFAGFVWAVEQADPLTAARVLLILQLAVVARYQGLGLGGRLVRRLIEQARDLGFHRIRGELSGGGLELSGFFAGLGFRSLSQVVELDPSHWQE